VDEVRKSLENYNSIGFVPTMGALHEGHLSLMKKSKEENEITIVSIYVNPTQFDNNEDLAKYPNKLQNDVNLLEKENVDFLFLPTYEEIYKDNFLYRIDEEELSKQLCGKSRIGHFSGVLTVVMKLLNIINPNNSYFGEKDFQQLLLIKGMVEAFFMKTKIIGLPTIREKDGLAMSSRNLRLSEEERKIAPKFYELLKTDLSDDEIIKQLEENGFACDYVETIGNRRFGAVFLRNVRLIDNVEK
jgi:pantoate--beta-alanine ligase